LSFTERLRLSRVALAFRRLDPADQKTDEQRLGDWLAAHGQDERTRRVLWDLFSVSSLNVPGDDASLALAAVVVQTGLLGKADAADIGVPALPLGELHGTAAAKLLAELGAEVRLSAKVASIEPEGDEFVIRLARAEGAMGEGPPHTRGGHRGDHFPGGKYGAVVLAVPHEQAAKLMPPGALPAETVDGWAGLGAAPIVNVHVVYDRKVMDVPFAAAVDSPVQWVFDRTRISGMHARGGAGQYLALSQSAADSCANMPVAELREIFLPALEALFPAAKDATVTEFFVTREKRATFRQVPGTAKLRPKAGTDLPGLVLAGSWTDTGWPDTMEGAVRSGLNAVIALAPAPDGLASAPDGKNRHHIGRGSKQYPPGGRPPVPPDVSAGADTGSAAFSPPSADRSSGMNDGATAAGRNATVNAIVNSSVGSGAVRGTNPENSGLDAGREAVTEVTEDNHQVNIEADEREVRS
jgi:squalene-associated FAD-dependent desaturase